MAQMIPDPVNDPSGYATYLANGQRNSELWALRNDLAKAAMQGLMASGNYGCQGSGSGSLIYQCQEIATCCYRLADAMIAESAGR